MSARLRKSVTRQWKKWGLKRAQMIVLACLADHINERDGDTWSFPGLVLICEETGFSRRWVQIALHELQKFGAFTVDSLVGGRSKPICYYFHIDDNHQVFLEFPPASVQEQEQPDEEKEVDQAQPATPVTPWEERPLEEQLRYVRAIVNKRSRLSDERRNYWQRELERIEAAIAARDAPASVDQAQPDGAEPEEAEPPVTLQECQEEIAAWQEKIDYYRLQCDGLSEFTPAWKYWQDRLNVAVDALYQWKQLARKAEAEALTIVPVAALSPPETPGAYVI